MITVICNLSKRACPENENQTGVHLLNWEAVCLPKDCEGLGFATSTSKTSLLRWWWKPYRTALFMNISGHEIYWNGRSTNGPSILIKHGSFFWMQLSQLKHFFNWSTTWEIHSGTSISFWLDSFGPENQSVTPTYAAGARHWQYNNASSQPAWAK
jgi:hypothetical protein